MKKNIYLAQINVTYSDRIAYIPYAAGCIAAYALSDRDFNEKFNIGELLFLREKPDEAIKRIENPFIVGFSCYIWNMEYNLTLAKMIKEKYPECLIVFGGHNIPFNTEVLEKAPFVDALIHGEGERAFVEYAKAAEKNDFSALKNISYRFNGEIFPAREGKTCVSLEELPSPYTAGLFDKMIVEYPTIDFQATLETNRGCPYSCAFCDWCFTEKIRYFPMEKIKKEIEWMSDKKYPIATVPMQTSAFRQGILKLLSTLLTATKKAAIPRFSSPAMQKTATKTFLQSASFSIKTEWTRA